MRKLFLNLIAPIASLFALASVEPAVAGQVTRLEGACNESLLLNYTTCDARVPYAVFSEGPGARYAIRFTAPAEHCSRIRYVLNAYPAAGAAGREVGYTDFLGPGETGAVELGDDLAAGRHDYYVMALGEVGGCNTGALGSWGVDVETIVIPT